MKLKLMCADRLKLKLSQFKSASFIQVKIRDLRNFLTKYVQNLSYLP